MVKILEKLGEFATTFIFFLIDTSFQPGKNHLKNYNIVISFECLIYLREHNIEISGRFMNSSMIFYFISHLILFQMISITIS